MFKEGLDPVTCRCKVTLIAASLLLALSSLN